MTKKIKKKIHSPLQIIGSAISALTVRARLGNITGIELVRAVEVLKAAEVRILSTPPSSALTAKERASMKVFHDLLARGLNPFSIKENLKPVGSPVTPLPQPLPPPDRKVEEEKNRQELQAASIYWHSGARKQWKRFTNAELRAYGVIE